MKLITFFLDYWRGTDPARTRYAWTMFWAIVLASVVTGVANTTLLGLVNRALNSLGQESSSLIWTYASLTLLIFAARFATEALLNLFLVRVVLDMQMSFCRHILAVPLRQLEEVGAPRLAAILSQDIRSIGDAFLAFIMVCMNLTIVLTCLIYLGWLSWQLLIGVLVFLVLGLRTYQIITDRAQGNLITARRSYNQLFGHYRALTEGNKELKLNRERRAEFVRSLFEPTAINYRQNIFRGNTIYNGAADIGQVFYFVLIGLVVFGAASLGIAEREVLMGYTLTILFMISPIEFIVSRAPVLGQAAIAVKNVEEAGLALTNTALDAEALVAPPPAPPQWQRLELKGLRHTYSDEQQKHSFQLGPLDLAFHPGEIVFVVGGNGSGKTTLAKLLVGLYVPEGGEIYLDGTKITDENRDDYRQHFSAVFSDFYLFDQLLGFDVPHQDEKAREYLAQLELDHKVEIEGGRLSTTDLSQGQRKRLALLTAYLEDRPFYVFDEWAANQDPIFRTVFYDQILPELKKRGKAILAITHDDKFFHVADRIIKLDYGQLEMDVAPSSAEAMKGLAAFVSDLDRPFDPSVKPGPVTA